jgi:hypothetical protein
MPPKAKKSPNDPKLIPEDVYSRVLKIKENKVAMKAPKGDLTKEEWCIPPMFHTTLGADFQQTIHYWKQCATVFYTERKDLKAPTRMAVVEQKANGTHTRKEITDLSKFLKGLVKQSNKRTGQFLKQLEKREGKELKRTNLLNQIAETDRQLNEELRYARRFTEKQELFVKKYMIGSKLGETGPKQKALVVIELSEKMGTWEAETKDEVTKLLNTVIRPDGGATTLNIATFSSAGVNMWMPTVPFQNKDDAKKGLDDAIKWLNKNFSAKTCGPQPFPPDWMGMITKLMGEGAQLPYRIFLCCSRSPGSSNAEVEAELEKLRQQDPPAKGEPTLPINVVVFDPSTEGDDDEKNFFDKVAGPSGSFLIDTSADDLMSLDKMLKSVATKKKQLDKLNKKLDKMEDLSEKVIEDRELLQVQIALFKMLENDQLVMQWALTNETPISAPEI